MHQIEVYDLKFILVYNRKLHCNVIYFKTSLWCSISLADLVGACRMHVPPLRDPILSFSHTFCWKAPVSKVHAPPTGPRSPLRGILDPPLYLLNASRCMLAQLTVCGSFLHPLEFPEVVCWEFPVGSTRQSQPLLSMSHILGKARVPKQFPRIMNIVCVLQGNKARKMIFLGIYNKLL